MRDVYEIRRTNLRLLIDQWGGPKPLAKKLGYANASFMVQMAGPNPTREITEKTARRIEQELGLPDHWMDNEVDHGNATGVNLALVTAVIRAVAQEADDLGVKLTPTKLSEVVHLVYNDAESEGAVRPEYITQLLRLMV